PAVLHCHQVSMKSAVPKVPLESTKIFVARELWCSPCEARNQVSDLVVVPVLRRRRHLSQIIVAMSTTRLSSCRLRSLRRPLGLGFSLNRRLGRAVGLKISASSLRRLGEGRVGGWNSKNRRDEGTRQQRRDNPC